MMVSPSMTATTAYPTAATAGMQATGVAQTAPASSGDGSVGLFDKVLMKAAIGGAAGAGLGFVLPFGGPIIGGVIGALGGAAIGLFGNWKKMDNIRKENDATLAAMGVQTSDPEVQKVLQSGNVEQLIPLVQQQQGMVSQDTTQLQSTKPMDYGTPVGQVTPAVDASALPNQSPVPTQATAAVLPGGGGAAGDAGRPVAPVGVESTDSAAIAPVQADLAADSTAPVSAEQVATAAQLSQLIAQLQEQIDELRRQLTA